MNFKKDIHGKYSGCKEFLFCLLLFGAAHLNLHAQLSYGGKPVYQEEGKLRDLPVISMPAFDAVKYRDEITEEMDSRLKPLIFARTFELSINPRQDGLWEETNDGRQIWRIALKSGGAYSLNIIFSRFMLRPGVSVFIYNEDKSHVLGAYNHLNNQLSGSLAVEPVEGEMLIIEMQVEGGIENYGRLEIGSLHHDFMGIMSPKSHRLGLSGKCNIDINCPPGNEWQTEKNAVARILTNGNQLCTGVMVNNTANDGEPYLMTANHCIDDSTKAANSVFLLGFESLFCNGSASPASKTLSGSDLLVTQENLDFTLVRIREMPPPSYRPWYAGWDRSAGIPESSVSIHHPNGDIKKLAIDNDPPSTGTFGSGYTANGHWIINLWEIGTTEGGSSGSPLFDQGGLLRGVLTGGDAGCGDAANDFYCRFQLAWDMYEGTNRQLEPWLDPLATGAEVLEGINPYTENELAADFTINTIEVCEGDRVVFTDFSTGGPDSWSWDFGPGADPPAAFSAGPHFVKYTEGGIRTVTLAITGNGNSDTREMEYNLAVKTENLPIAGFSYTEDELSVQFHDLSDNAASWYWEFGNGRISTHTGPVHKYADAGNYIVKQLVRNRACSDTMTHMILVTSLAGFEESVKNEIKIYPVPAGSYVIIESDIRSDDAMNIELLTITGKSLLLKRAVPGSGTSVLDLSGIPPGTYILRISIGSNTITRKITVIG